MRRRKTGPARMKELGRKKIEVWLSAAAHARFEKFAQELGLATATAARRAMNHAADGGTTWGAVLRRDQYD